ncbi:MAG: nucleotidyltransferase domain-containing protein [archaeon]
MAKTAQIIQKILSKINPSPKERKAVGAIVEEAMKICRKTAKNSEIVLCGSFAKDTYLSGIRDVDIFLVAREGRTAETDCLADAEACAKALSPKGYERKFSSHKYFTADFKGYKFDLVPAYPFKPGEALRSSVDRTPLHAEYINGNLSDKAVARLMKAFCRGVGVYGADAKNQGFSGYLCELIAAKEGTFEQILKSSAGMKHPLEIPDPVDSERNVASAVSEDSLERFKRSAKAFLSKPSELFFFQGKVPAKVPALNSKKQISLIYKETFEAEDALYSKARSNLAQIVKDVSDIGFSVKRSGFAASPASGEVLFILEFDKMFLPRTRIVEGPPLSVRRDYIDAFVSKHGKEKVYQKKGRLYAKEDRKIFEARQAVLAMGRTFLPTFALVESQKALSAIFRELPDGEKRRLCSFLLKREVWQV